MGLTIYYTLTARAGLDESAMRKLVAEARAFACQAEVDSVSRVIKVDRDFPLAHEFLALPDASGEATHIDVFPEAAGPPAKAASNRPSSGMPNSSNWSTRE